MIGKGRASPAPATLAQVDPEPVDRTKTLSQIFYSVSKPLEWTIADYYSAVMEAHPTLERTKSQVIQGLRTRMSKLKNNVSRRPEEAVVVEEREVVLDATPRMATRSAKISVDCKGLECPSGDIAEETEELVGPRRRSFEGDSVDVSSVVPDCEHLLVNTLSSRHGKSVVKPKPLTKVSSKAKSKYLTKRLVGVSDSEALIPSGSHSTPAPLTQIFQSLDNPLDWKIDDFYAALVDAFPSINKTKQQVMDGLAARMLNEKERLGISVSPVKVDAGGVDAPEGVQLRSGNRASKVDGKSRSEVDSRRRTDSAIELDLPVPVLVGDETAEHALSNLPLVRDRGDGSTSLIDGACQDIKVMPAGSKCVALSQVFSSISDPLSWNKHDYYDAVMKAFPEITKTRKQIWSGLGSRKFVVNEKASRELDLKRNLRVDVKSSSRVSPSRSHIPGTDFDSVSEEESDEASFALSGSIGVDSIKAAKMRQKRPLPSSEESQPLLKKQKKRSLKLTLKKTLEPVKDDYVELFSFTDGLVLGSDVEPFITGQEVDDSFQQAPLDLSQSSFSRPSGLFSFSPNLNSSVVLEEPVDLLRPSCHTDPMLFQTTSNISPYPSPPSCSESSESVVSLDILPPIFQDEKMSPNEVFHKSTMFKKSTSIVLFDSL